MIFFNGAIFVVDFLFVLCLTSFLRVPDSMLFELRWSSLPFAWLPTIRQR
jgi:hypothetical protein